MPAKVLFDGTEKARRNLLQQKIAYRPFVGVLSQITLWSVSYSACVVYTKTIIHLSVCESGGYN